MKKVLVLGDVMLDVTTHVRVKGYSPEVEHIPVLHFQKTTYGPGGAANVAAGVRAMGAEPLLFGVVSDDATAIELTNQLWRQQVSYVNELWQGGCTTRKDRVCTPSGMLYRLDTEKVGILPEDYWKETSLLYRHLKQHMHIAGNDNPPVVVLVNYDKGFFRGFAASRIMDVLREELPPILIDPGRDGDWYAFGGPTVTFKANVSQCMQMYKTHTSATRLMQPLDNPDQFSADTYMEPSVMHSMGWRIRHNLINLGIEFKYGVITCGCSGMVLFASQSEEVVIIHGEPVPVCDVCGAGDTVLAALAAELAVAKDYEYNTMKEAANFADRAARVAVQMRGVTVVQRAMVR